MTDLEEVRSRFQPCQIGVLFVGESPPQNGTFPYLKNSNLFRYTREAFCEALGACFTDGFLDNFRDNGCFLEDLCGEPVNKLSKRKKKRACQDAVGKLVLKLQAAQPSAVICVMRRISPIVQQALRVAGFASLPFWSVPFPAQGHQREYVRELVQILGCLNKAGLLWRVEAPPC